MSYKVNKGGRPSKYHETFIQEVDKFIEQRKKENKLPTLAGLAVQLNVTEDTLANWAGKHKRFLGAINRLKHIQRDILITGVYEDSKAHGSGGIFLLINNHGFKNKTETDLTSGGKPLPQPIVAITNDVLRDNSDKKD
jgi:hypothetical protein